MEYRVFKENHDLIKTELVYLENQLKKDKKYLKEDEIELKRIQHTVKRRKYG